MQSCPQSCPQAWRAARWNWPIVGQRGGVERRHDASHVAPGDGRALSFSLHWQPAPCGSAVVALGGGEGSAIGRMAGVAVAVVVGSWEAFSRGPGWVSTSGLERGGATPGPVRARRLIRAALQPRRPRGRRRPLRLVRRTGRTLCRAPVGGLGLQIWAWSAWPGCTCSHLVDHAATTRRPSPGGVVGANMDAETTKVPGDTGTCRCPNP